MILQIRTKNNIDELLQNGKSPAWVISEYRLPQIIKVEIYQFDGKRVLKADFNAELSTRTENDRLVVAFSNGVIEDSNHDWDGQNPVRYKEFNTQDSTRENNKLFDNWIPFSELQKIEEAHQSKNELLPDILKEIFDNYNYKYSGWLYASSFEEMLENIQKMASVYFSDSKDVTTELSNIKNNDAEGSLKWYQLLEWASKTILKEEGIIIKTLFPRGGEDYSCLLFKEKKLIKSILIYHHFADALNNAVGIYEEFTSDYKDSYEDFLINNNLEADINISPLEYSVEDSVFGKLINSNKWYLNITREVYPCAIAGMRAAKKFC
jgi:hypothetical protein